MRHRLLSCAVAAAMAVGGIAGITSQAQAAVTNVNLGFILDASGSVGSTNFNNARTALANAISANIPTSDPDFTYTIGVSVFGSSGAVGYSATTVTDATSLGTVVSGIQGISYNLVGHGSTCFNCGFTNLNTAFGGSVAAGDISIINMTTDGNNNSGTLNQNTLKNTLKIAGWDSLSFEAIGQFVSTGPLVTLGFDTTNNSATLIANAAAIGNPLTNAFVLPIANFGPDYSAALNKKIQESVAPIPIPAALPLLLSGLAALGGLGAMRRRSAAAA